MITNTDSVQGVGNGFTGDLRYCVALANADVANGVSATVTFAAGLDGQTITTQNGPIELTDASASTTITAAGQGITISGFNFATLLGNTTSGSNRRLGTQQYQTAERGYAGNRGRYSGRRYDCGARP